MFKSKDKDKHRDVRRPPSRSNIYPQLWLLFHEEGLLRHHRLKSYPCFSPLSSMPLRPMLQRTSGNQRQISRSPSQKQDVSPHRPRLNISPRICKQHQHNELPARPRNKYASRAGQDYPSISIRGERHMEAIS